MAGVASEVITGVETEAVTEERMAVATETTLSIWMHFLHKVTGIIDIIIL